MTMKEFFEKVRFVKNEQTTSMKDFPECKELRVQRYTGIPINRDLV